MSFGVLKSLVLYLILSGIVLNFSPNSNYKRYIRFFLGLLILILLAEPIQFIFHMSSCLPNLQRTIGIWWLSMIFDK